MTGFPGPHPMHGDTVYLTIGDTSVVITGRIRSQGVLRDGRGFVELTLPDADPQQRRDLERATSYRYELYREDALLYSSPRLALSETRRAGDGALVVAGCPG
ncbi:hypothetical protein ACM01_43560 [Streptomyces viridochromogenes]|uniref:Uncharacterized protein n=1 Tax=Streptomyces viridochromogenes TaxID=1938 RepID=A0A0J7YU96_STRVR|nr:hypothetical protein [Streptomyces viridochromogenes]KMS67241.1 hypothetical protein ACM01_43560 [Streptomyces viridochromogenes]KOG26344.1 hypothetical protein ADK36_03490 [Streptomyces viridochromogenes]KOG27985.1 hypothetical protein ADK35_04500 [Streptomyces viridochromogenes]